ncbi:hypothetical protein Tco_1213150 [Tanacetum coccineum]
MASACAFRAEEMPSLISCRMASKVMTGVSDVDVLLGGILSTKDDTYSSGIKKHRGLNSSDGGNIRDRVKIAGGVIGSELLLDEDGKNMVKPIVKLEYYSGKASSISEVERLGEDIILLTTPSLGHMGDDVESLGAVLERLWCKVEVDGGGFGSCGVRVLAAAEVSKKRGHVLSYLTKEWSK